MHSIRVAGTMVVAVLLASGCRPRVFSDTAGFQIVGHAPPPAVVATPLPTHIELREKVQFARDSHKILEVSHGILDEAAAKILAEPGIKKIRVEGHASADGNDEHNLELSQRRARAVRLYLVTKGVPEAKLISEGYGETQPIADNETPEGREANRRVELEIIEREESAPTAAAP
jgi:outer membrane protein OmpA-like peptidoglycan-associated protein